MATQIETMKEVKAKYTELVEKAKEFVNTCADAEKWAGDNNKTETSEYLEGIGVVLHDALEAIIMNEVPVKDASLIINTVRAAKCTADKIRVIHLSGDNDLGTILDDILGHQ